MPAIVYEGVERQELEIPLKDIIGERGEVSIYPEIQAHGYFDIRFRKNQLRLTAGQYIGQIPLNENVIIDVKPKVPFGNLVHLVGKSGRRLSLLDFFTRTYANIKSQPANMFEFLCRCLSIELRWVIREGIYREYREFERGTSMPRGRPLFSRTIATRWSKGEFHRMDVSFFQLTNDTLHNRLIKYTIWYCLNHLHRVGSVDPDLTKELSKYWALFSSVHLDRSRSFLKPILETLSHTKIPVIRRYYENIEQICLVIIQNVGFDLIAKGADYETSSFVLDLADIFEAYVLALSKEVASKVDQSIRVLDGNTNGKGYLFSNTRRYEAKPDVIIQHEGRTIAILDAKYKTRIDESDRYQIIAHAVAFNTNIAIHVVPGSHSSKGLESVGTLGVAEPINVYKYNLDIESESMKFAENDFEIAIDTLLGNSI